MEASSVSSAVYKRGLLAAVLVFAAALTTNFIQVTHNLDTGHLAGHEFRQSQTALSILFIQQESNYDLAYPTPVFGPPWSIPMEFPLYQWASAALGARTGESIPRTSRIISIGCFYLALMAAFLLLIRFSTNVATALLATSAILFAPVYIFYSRAILIESMALALSLWFLLAFDIVRRRGSWGAVVATAILGGLAAMVKVTTFATWGGIALGLGIFQIWRLAKDGSRRECKFLVIKSAIAGVLPLLAGVWWVRFADAIKADSPGGFFLTSENLSSFNLGSIGSRLDLDLWQGIWGQAAQGLLPAWSWLLLVGALVVGIKTRRIKTASWMIVATLGTWLTFPHLYQIHDYYLYAIGMLPLAAIAMALQNFIPNQRWFWVPSVVVLILGGMQWRSYARNYLPQQSVISNGGDQMYDFLSDATSPDDVLIVAGGDWSASVPYFTQRRTLTFSRHIHHRPDLVRQMMNSIDAHEVAGLILFGDADGAKTVIKESVDRFDIAPNPTLQIGRLFYYARKDLRKHISFILNASTAHQDITLLENMLPMVKQTDEIIADFAIHPVTPNLAKSIFSLISPSPTQYRVEFGLFLGKFENAAILGAHADTDLWIPWDRPKARFTIEHGLLPYQHEDANNHSDGVWFRVWGVTRDGNENLIWERWIDPWNNPEERGLLQASFEAETDQYYQFRFATRAGPNKAYDSAFWGSIQIR